MPFLTQCPTCSRSLRVPDELSGRNVKCPDCGATFPAGTAGEAPPVPTAAPDQPSADWQADEHEPVADRPRARSRRSLSDARGAVLGPGICLIIFSLLWMAFAGLFLLGVVGLINQPQEKQKILNDFKSGKNQQGPPPTPEQVQQMQAVLDFIGGPGGIVVAAVGFGLSLLVLFGGIQMLRLRSRGLVIFASILAVIPCIAPCCMMPFGIWSLVVVNRPDVVDAFRHSSNSGYRDDADVM